MNRAAPGSPADQQSEPQASSGADAGAAGEPVLSHAAASAAGKHSTTRRILPDHSHYEKLLNLLVSLSLR